ncbi:general secretion pathway protein [Pollutimonas sp. M17]|uniref:general secretion pathway protein n=1 Tax=Pollutimonas sp. M17 TaxID=2962065 RepID=UPI0021F3E6F7|nr:general secretion pathway protein [Pollutimonas sp. M17]UYO92371.1 general secretion pathway protein [Pollutimonas sp. M17]
MMFPSLRAHGGWPLRSLLSVFDGWRFRSARADYYDYLSVLLEGMQGARTLKEIFESDARRYGGDSVRGRLSQRWLIAYQAAGGDLHATWSGSFPPAELGLIRAAQTLGNTALVRTLAELSSVLRLLRQTRSILGDTLWAGGLAVLAVFAMLLAIPGFTVPRLLQTFSSVPAAYHGRLTQELLHCAELIQSHWLFMAVLAAGSGGLILWSLSNASGPLRRKLDRHAVWRIYRYIQALRLLSLVTLLLGRGDAGAVQLKTALFLLKGGASAWQEAQVDSMLARIDAGMAGAETFNTGLLDPEQFWFLSDMVMARGLHAGLALAAERLRSHVLETVARQALALRWILLLASLFCLLGMAAWHYAVIDELRRSLMLFHASQ